MFIKLDFTHKQDFKERPFLIEEFLTDNLFWFKWIENTGQVDWRISRKLCFSKLINRWEDVYVAEKFPLKSNLPKENLCGSVPLNVTNCCYNIVQIFSLFTFSKTAVKDTIAAGNSKVLVNFVGFYLEK